MDRPLLNAGLPPPPLPVTIAVLTGRTNCDLPTCSGTELGELGAGTSPRHAAEAAGRPPPPRPLPRAVAGPAIASGEAPPPPPPPPATLLGSCREGPAAAPGNRNHLAPPAAAARRGNGSRRRPPRRGSASPHPILPCPALARRPRPHAPSRLSPCRPSAPAASGFLRRRRGGRSGTSAASRPFPARRCPAGRRGAGRAG